MTPLTPQELEAAEKEVRKEYDKATSDRRRFPTQIYEDDMIGIYQDIAERKQALLARANNALQEKEREIERLKLYEDAMKTINIDKSLTMKRTKQARLLRRELARLGKIRRNVSPRQEKNLRKTGRMKP